MVRRYVDYGGAPIPVVTDFRGRMFGLMGKTREQAGAGLMLRPCRSVHTAFMRFAIDVLFLDKHGRILKLCSGVKPWRVAWAPWRTSAVLELPAGDACSRGFGTGCVLYEKQTSNVAGGGK